jgi:hypothetical protein
MARWLLPVLGIGVALVAGWLLLTSPDDAPERGPAAGAAPAPHAKPAPPSAKPGRPMGEIDEASRRELEAVLEAEGIGP